MGNLRNWFVQCSDFCGKRKDWRKDIRYVRVHAECRASVRRIIGEFLRLWREEGRAIRIITFIIIIDDSPIRQRLVAMPKKNLPKLRHRPAYRTRITRFIYQSIKNLRLSTFFIREEGKRFRKEFTCFWNIRAAGCASFTTLLCKYFARNFLVLVESIIRIWWENSYEWVNREFKKKKKDFYISVDRTVSIVRLLAWAVKSNFMIDVEWWCHPRIHLPFLDESSLIFFWSGGGASWKVLESLVKRYSVKK